MSTDPPAERRNAYPWALIGLFVAVSAWGNWLHSAGAAGVYRVLPALVPISAAFAWHLLVLRHFDGTERADRYRRLAARLGAAVVFAWTMVGSWDALVQVGQRGRMPHPTALPVAVDGLVFVAALAVWTARHQAAPPAVVAELAALRAELERVRASIPVPVSAAAVRADVTAAVLAELAGRETAAAPAAGTGTRDHGQGPVQGPVPGLKQGPGRDRSRDRAGTDGRDRAGTGEDRMREFLRGEHTAGRVPSLAACDQAAGTNGYAKRRGADGRTVRDRLLAEIEAGTSVVPIRSRDQGGTG